MKRIILMAILLCTALAATQAQKKQTVFLELLGPSTVFGVHYDTRFHANTNWGMRVGLACTASNGHSFLPESGDLRKAVTIPFDLNYLIGKRKHFVELGVGLNNGLYFANRDMGSSYHRAKVAWGYFIYFDAGYRFQPAEGLSLRAGFNPGFSLNNGENGVEREAVIYPYISVGYSF